MALSIVEEACNYPAEKILKKKLLKSGVLAASQLAGVANPSQERKRLILPIGTNLFLLF